MSLPMKLSLSTHLIPLVLCATLLGCDNEGTDRSTTVPTDPNVSISTELATALDERFLLQIKKTMDVIESQKLWQGYDYKSVPQYFIRRENGKPVTAFVINPQTTIDNAQQLGKNESQGLNVLQYEGSMNSANDKLKAGNDAYDYDFTIDGKGYYIQSYSQDDVDILDPIITSSFSLAVHEVFHAYQGKNFKNNPNYEQLAFNKFSQYPLNNELLSLQLMLMDTLKGFPVNAISQAEAKIALRKYYVIVHEMLKRDPTAHSGFQTGLIYKHGLGQELYEGSALYIDKMASRNVLEVAKDSKFIFQIPYEMDKVSNGYATLKAQKDVIDYFAFQVFYYTGANAIWLLSQTGYDLKQLEGGIYPYDAAKGYLKMSEVEEMNLLAEMKQSTQWTQAQAAALRYNSL
tara:strand:- start:143 stop:1351 length:1209 start_codon:yes stop_codon:yes gene_type:complete